MNARDVDRKIGRIHERNREDVEGARKREM